MGFSSAASRCPALAVLKTSQCWSDMKLCWNYLTGVVFEIGSSVDDLLTDELRHGVKDQEDEECQDDEDQ